ncbi:4080_t:CDS:2 [Diversispora eburnea]|uniref:4080_t:CDS:1 n=1 Tax=Diversispora eburnea TaxID=1213867 RepID=A0A9N9A5Z3_9GLOM|nr:4080_t:CDS:2 [Diversispora eburnea]
MGLPMFVSPSLKKRQLPPKQPQPQSPPYTPYEDSDFPGDSYQNSRTSAFGNHRYFIRRNISSFPFPLPYATTTTTTTATNKIPDFLQPRNPVQQQLQQLQQLHRTREHQIASSNLATRRGMQLHSAQLLSIRAQQLAAQQLAQQQQQQQQQLAQQAVQRQAQRHEELRRQRQQEIERQELQRQQEELHRQQEELHRQQQELQQRQEIQRQQEAQRQLLLQHQLLQQQQQQLILTNISNMTNTVIHQNNNMDLFLPRNLIQLTQQHTRPSSRHHRSNHHREELIQRGIDVPQLIRVPPTFPTIPEVIPPPISRRLQEWNNVQNVRRGEGSPSEQHHQQPQLNHTSHHSSSSSSSSSSRILSPMPRRFDPRFNTSFTPEGILTERIVINKTQEGSASGEVC